MDVQFYMLVHGGNPCKNPPIVLNAANTATPEEGCLGAGLVGLTMLFELLLSYYLLVPHITSYYLLLPPITSYYILLPPITAATTAAPG